MPLGRCLMIGIGNPLCGDDEVGRIVARRLRGRCAAGVRVVEHDGELASLVACLAGADRAYIADASVTGRPLGTISRFDLAATPSKFHPGTFAFHSDDIEYVFGTLLGLTNEEIGYYRKIEVIS